MQVGAGSVVRPSIPLTVLTGFLGAGKTTLLKRILTGDHGLRIAVLVNDFGSINIDADLVVGVDNGGDVISLANGCVCCNIRTDLLTTVQRLIERPEQPEYVVLEASGVADPSGIAATFLDVRLRDRIRLDSIMCVMDASQVFEAPETMALKLRQIAFADMLILNKIDLVSRDDIVRVRAWLDTHFHRYRLVEASRGDVPLDILLSAGRFDAAQLNVRDHQQGSGGFLCDDSQQPLDPRAAFWTWSYETYRPVSLEALREVVRKLPASIYRCKGVIHSADDPGRRAILQVVGKRVDLSLDGGWGDGPARTRIVTIGAPGSLDRAALKASFDTCVLPTPAPPAPLRQ